MFLSEDYRTPDFVRRYRDPKFLGYYGKAIAGFVAPRAAAPESLSA